MYDELPAHDQDLFQHGLHVGLVMNEYHDQFGRGDFLVRNLYGVDRATGAMAITDRVRVGQTVQFHVRDAATADEDLRLLLRQELAHTAAKPRSRARCSPATAAARACSASRTTTPPRWREEIGPVPLAGLFAAGEFGPVGGRNFIHGFTASVVLFDDATPPAAAAGP